MRKLTILREKSFVACLGTMKVYVEDHDQFELTINDVPCRKIGNLKNGEEVSFEIDNKQLKIFVIGDKLSRNICNEFYVVPAGENDVFLSGKNHYNPAAGNPFRFNGINDEEILANRKKNSKKGIFVLIAAIIIGFAVGFSITYGILSKNNKKETVPETFTYGNFSIVLTDDFTKQDVPQFNAAYANENICAYVLLESYAAYPELEQIENDVNSYAELTLVNNNMNYEIKKENGLTYFEFDSNANNNSFHFLAAFYVSEDGFWIVQFAALSDKFEEQRNDIIKYAQSVKFK